MRILLKILLFPVVLVLTVLVAFCRFFCLFSGLILPCPRILIKQQLPSSSMNIGWSRSRS